MCDYGPLNCVLVDTKALGPSVFTPQADTPRSSCAINYNKITQRVYDNDRILDLLGIPFVISPRAHLCASPAFDPYCLPIFPMGGRPK